MNAAAPQQMHCLEVWGGNRAVDSGVILAGLDAWVFSRPCGDDALGGDVHYVSSCATGRITRLLVADVSGHGVTVAETAAKLRTLMRRYVNHIDQRKFVQGLNAEFAALHGGGSYATAIAATFFAPTNTLSVCNAGHPPPLLYRRKPGRWSFLEPSRRRRDTANIPLGVVDIASYDQRRITLDIGDLLLCYTDCLLEARDRAGDLLGKDGLLDIVRSLDPDRYETLVHDLVRTVESLAAANLTGDDLTALLIRPNGRAARVPWPVRLCMPFRLLGAFVRSLGRGHPMPWPELSVPSLGGAVWGVLNRFWTAEDRAKPPQPRPLG